MREDVAAEARGDHVRGDRVADAHLGRLFGTVDGPEEAADVDNPQQEEEDQRQHHRELRPGRSAARFGQPPHDPVTAASEFATSVQLPAEMSGNPPISGVYGTLACTRTRAATFPFIE